MAGGELSRSDPRYVKGVDDAYRKAVHAAEYAARKATRLANTGQSFHQVDKARRSGQPLPGDVGGRRRQVVDAGGKKMVRTTVTGKGEGVVRSQLDKAGDAGVGVEGIKVTTKDGNTFTIDKKGRTADGLRDAIAKAGGLASYVAAAANATIYGEDLDWSDIADVEIYFDDNDF